MESSKTLAEGWEWGKSMAKGTGLVLAGAAALGVAYWYSQRGKASAQVLDVTGPKVVDKQPVGAPAPAPLPPPRPEVEAAAKAVGPAQLVPVAVNELLKRGRAADRVLIQEAQASVGVVADGLYGPVTRAAFLKYDQRAPKALYGAKKK